MAGPDRLERLTDLVLVLLNASRPISLAEVGREVPGYPSAPGARRQAFERDKRLLREEGIPVLTEPVEGPEQFGYRIDPAHYYLPDLDLEPDEQAALHRAVAGVHLGDPSGRSALEKLGAGGGPLGGPLAALAPPPALVPLFEATMRRAEVHFAYREQRRQVAPGGVWFRRGRWYLVGWDRGRDALRTFRVDRIVDVQVGAEGSGSLPPDVDPAAAVPDEPWRIGEGDDEVVEVLVDAVEAPRVADELGPGAVVERRPDGTMRFRLEVTNPPALRAWVLSLLDHAEVLAPPAVRQSVVEWLEAIVAAPRPAAGDAGAGGNAGAAGGAGADADASAADAGRVPTPPAEGPSTEGPPTEGPPTEGPPTEGPSTEGPPTEETGHQGAAGPAPSDPAAPLRAAGARLRRLLAMLGWLAQHGEASITEVSARFGVPREELVRELELAACCGVPPYTPDTLMEIVVTGTSVQAFLPKELAQPRRLTAAEGFALVAAGHTILAVPGADPDDGLARAVAKLERVLGDRRGVVVDLDEPPLLGRVRATLAEHGALEIRYHSDSKDETTTRVVEPYRVLTIGGRWYVDAYCHRAQGTRRFRIDRIRSAEPVTAAQPEIRSAEPVTAAQPEIRSAEPVTAAQPAPASEPRRPARDEAETGPAFVPGPDAEEVVLELDRAGEWLLDGLPVTAVAPRAEGGQVVRLAVGGHAWLRRLLLQLGPDARVLEPPALRSVAAESAATVLSRYR